MWKKNFVLKIYSENREYHAVKVIFYFIPISQSITEIAEFKFHSIQNNVKIINGSRFFLEMHTFFQESLVWSLK